MTWIYFNDAVRRTGLGQFDLSSADASWKVSLHGTTASANLVGDVSAWSDIGSEVNTGGYPAGGIPLAGVGWASVSAGEFRFDFDDPVFTASGEAMTGIRFIVVRASVTNSTDGYPLCYAALDTVNFSVSDGNTLTVQLNTNGAFTFGKA